jgi:adenine-specific DNA-methyltransferase
LSASSTNKAFLPDSYTSFKNKIGLATPDGRYLSQNRDVVLVWPYKDCVLEGGQTKEEQKREEIFWNEILAPDEIDRLLAPKVLTNWRRYDVDGDHDVTGLQENDNLILKGNNLLVLATLKKRFTGEVKLIYIDPPFNTGNDSFGYNDAFNHSSWLSFMKNRLEIAKDLLREDGLIFVHLDDNEDAYLKVLLDEIFGEENYIATVAIKSATPSGVKTAHKDKTIINTKNSIHVYRKTSQARINPQYTRRSGWDTHFNLYLERETESVNSLTEVMRAKGLLSQDESLKDIDLDNQSHYEFYIGEATNIFQSKSHSNFEARNLSLAQPNQPLFINKDQPDEEIFLNGRQLYPLAKSINEVVVDNQVVEDFAILLGDFWDDIDFNNMQNEGGTSFPKGKKPEALLYRIISMATQPGEIVLDFFLGSGTTAAVAHKMNRRYIGIEQMNYGDNDSIARLKNVVNNEQTGISKALGWKGGGSFVYAELMQWNEQFVDQLQWAEDKETLQTIWQEMQSRAHLSYRLDWQQFDEIASTFADLSFDDQRRFLLEMLDKNQLYVNLSEIDDETYTVSSQDKTLNRQFYRN